MKNLFYSTRVFNNQIELDEEESAHAQRVLRLTQGDAIWITNGEGLLYECAISELTKKSVLATVQSVKTIDRPVTRIHLAIAPTKNMDRLEWLVEKLVETGITSITPVLCNHSERKVLKTERLKKIAVTAMKQSQQCWLPEIHELTPFSAYIKTVNANSGKLIAHCRKPGLPVIQSVLNASIHDYMMLIGPEGDFSEAEIEMALQSGWKEISLGENRLRTETAGLVACLAVHFISR